MAKRWRIATHDPQRIAALASSAGVSAIVANLLIGRDISDQHVARDFLDAKLTALRDPELLPGVVAAADRIYAAVVAQRRIVIYGDYDADGMTGTALLHRCLTLLGAQVSFYVPNRMDEGYGLNHDAIRTLVERGAQLIVTVDCGIASLAEARTARQLGVELIVTDHHEFAESLPVADAIVHPQLPGHSYPFNGLSGAGVAFKLAWALCQRSEQAKKVSPRMKDFLLQSVGLAALGTVADMVPMLDENRILVRHGLASLRERPTLGLAHLLKVTQLDQKPALSCEDVAFMLAPCLNAAGRLGQAPLAVELLMTTAPQRAQALAEYLRQLNGNRDTLERSVYLAAHKQVHERFDPDEDAALVLADYDWHPGVIGIVAGRLAEKFHRPVVMISLDKVGAKPAVGSARSVPGFNLHQALAHCTRYLVSHGGHAAAAGLKIDPPQLEAFRAEFCAHAGQQIDAAGRQAELRIDAETPLSGLTLQTVEQIESLAPFGLGNARPLLCAAGVKLAEAPKRIGASGRHLSMRLVQHASALRAVAFGGGDWADQLAAADAPLDIAFRPVINDFRGRRSVELHLVDWRISAAVTQNVAAISSA